jgi:hypothetical protein
MTKIRTNGMSCIMSNPAPPPLANNIDVLRIEAIKKPFTKLSFVNLKFST